MARMQVREGGEERGRRTVRHLLFRGEKRRRKKKRKEEELEFAKSCKRNLRHARESAAAAESNFERRPFFSSKLSTKSKGNRLSIAAPGAH